MVSLLYSFHLTNIIELIKNLDEALQLASFYVLNINHSLKFKKIILKIGIYWQKLMFMEVEII